MEKHYRGVSESLRKFISDGTPDFVVDRYAALKAAAESEEYGAFDNDVVVVDTEATGFSFNHDELIQIAAARVTGGKIVDWYITFVDPGKPIPEDIVHLTGIDDDDVAGAPDPNTALAGLANFVGTSYVVAHNVSFDKTFTTKHPGGYPLLDNVWIDTLDLARIALPHLSSHRLLDLVRAFDCPVSTHRADADVAATCAVLRVLLAGVDAMPVSLVCKIASLANPDQWSTQVVFQYFANKKMEALGKESAEEGAAERKNVDLDFSLRHMRADRVRAIERAEKRDAESLTQDPLVEVSYPTSEEIDHAFTAEGIVGRLYESYEQRDEQVEMAQAVRGAFEANENLMVEAGTGVGKSMAYLVPAALFAKRNNVAVGVATKTNALLDQLVYKELPALSETVGGLAFAPLKGFAHYPCLRKIDQLVADGARMKEIAGKEVSQAPALAALLSFIEQSEYEDIDTLKIDYRSVPRYTITTTSHDCLRRKCPFFGVSCFVHGARRQAESADIVVTNHTLLFCDLAADGGLLPTCRHWIIDEAHGAEDEARKAFSSELSAEELIRLANRMASTEASRNPFVRAERRVVAEDEGAESLLYALTAKAKKQGSAFALAAQDFVLHMKDLLFFDSAKRGKGYEYFELWLSPEVRESPTFSGLREFGRKLCAETDRLISACQDLVAFLEDYEKASDVQRDIASVAMTLKDILKAAEIVLGPASDSYAYSATLNRKKDRNTERLEALMVEVGPRLNETLYERTHSVVFTSATIAVSGRFDSFEAAMGLNVGESSCAQGLVLRSSFDFDKNMTVYVASDMPEPNELAYLPALENFLVETHRAQQGSMLTLFTNRKEMERCHEGVAETLKRDDLRVVCQKWGVSTKGLRDEFLSDEHLSLFALKSFWEGFDAPGSTLRGVFIPKLPFSKPTDPLYCERAARDDRAWRHYVLPAAIIEVKQAAGRLIRKADDRGCLILADKRLVSKRYGKAFLDSLPSRNIKVMTMAEIARDIRENRQD